jgi:GAF domain-containing protein
MLYNPDILNHQGVMEGISLPEKKFTVLQEIAGAMVATGDTNALSYLMLDFVINYTGAEKGSIMLLSEKSELYILAARGIDSQLIRSYRVKVGEGIAGTVAQRRMPILVEDIEKDERFRNLKRDRYKTRSFISCPMISKNRLLGVLNIHDKKNGTPFSKDEFDLVTVIANQAAIVLENASLMNQLRMNTIELEEINRKLMETDAVKTEFLTRLSHELRTPLNSIKGSVYYLRKSEKMSEPEQKEFYDIIFKESEKLISIVENLLDFLRLEDETRIVKKSLLNLDELLRSLQKSKPLKAILARKNLALEMDIPGEVSDIVGDRVWASQFFMNLIDGLSWHLEKGDTISISIKDNDYLEVRLSLPRRMPDSMLPYLFDSRQIFKSNQPEKGTKLYLAWKIAEMHRWKLTAMNTDDRFTLKITLPKSARQMVETAISDSMDMFIEFISEIMDVNACSIMLCDELTGDLTIRGAKGLEDDIVKRTRLRFGDRIAGWVAVQGEPLLIEDIETHSVFSRKNIPRYGSGSLLSVPLKVKGNIVGVVNYNNKKSSEPFTPEDLVLATVISERVSKFIERVKDREYSGESLKQFLSYFDTLLEAERKYHKKKGLIPEMITRVMEAVGAPDEEKELALYVSVIYDLGLMLIDENILKKETLLPAEVRTLRAHPHFTVNLLNNFEFSDKVKKSVLHHHERYDGQGYPDGLRGEDIPLISRVLSVVDAFCAMTSERPYGKKLSKDEALEEIRKGAGSIYDPRVVSALEKVL